jgi:hypothetical protein
LIKILKKFTRGATNQNIADAHSIKLCGKLFSTKYPTHKSIRSAFNNIAIVFKFSL